MRINTNVSAFDAWRNSRSVDDAMAKSLERLSSGLRVNRASDDAAGLSISESLRAQLRGTAQAAKNSQDGISLTQLADGGLNEIAGALQRMRELAVQAANGTYGLAERSSMQQEVSQLMSEIDQIAANTTFNGIQLLSGASASQAQGVQDAMQQQLLKDAWDEVMSAYNFSIAPGFNLPIYFDATGPAGVVAYVSFAGAPGATEQLHVILPYFTANSNQGNAPQYNDRVLAHELTHAAMAEEFNMFNFDTWFIEGTAEFVQGADERIAGDLGTSTPTAAQYDGLLSLLGTGGSWATDSAHYSAATVATRYLDAKLRAAGHGTGIRYLMDTYLQANPNATMDMIVSQAGYANKAAFFADLAANGGTWAAANIHLNDAGADTGSIIGEDYTGTNLDAAGVVANGPTALPADWTPWNEQWMAASTTSTITLQVGANNGQTFEINPVDATSGALGIGSVDLTTSAGSAISAIDQAIASVSGLRSTFGAAANRLEHTIANLDNGHEQMASAESRIRDTDMAAEMTTLTRAQILAQSSQSMVAIAAFRPRSLLTLLEPQASSTA